MGLSSFKVLSASISLCEKVPVRYKLFVRFWCALQNADLFLISYQIYVCYKCTSFYFSFLSHDKSCQSNHFIFKMITSFSYLFCYAYIDVPNLRFFGEIFAIVLYLVATARLFSNWPAFARSLLSRCVWKYAQKTSSSLLW